MHAALAKGEFELWIQPKVDVITQRVVGAEALVRWQSGLFGLMMPARFIPLFERNGFVREVDFYLLDQVCRRLKAQLERGEKIVPVSLNQSRHHSYSPYYLEQLRLSLIHILAKHKTPRYVAFVDGFPMNAAGKILKYKMREDAVEMLGLQQDNAIETA